jgi:hypothetical protein
MWSCRLSEEIDLTGTTGAGEKRSSSMPTTALPQIDVDPTVPISGHFA